MTGAEFSVDPKQPNFEDVVDTISKLVVPHEVSDTAEDGGEVEYPGWDGSVRGIELEPAVAAQAGLGQAVNARVIGDYETGVAIIMRSRNLFDTRRYGFFIQPERTSERLRGFEVWQAPAQKPKRGLVYWGFELLDREQASQSSTQVTKDLINSLQLKAK